MSNHRYRATLRTGSSPLTRGEHEGQVSIVCAMCYQTHLIWYPRLAEGAEGHARTRILRCADDARCGAPLLVYITDQWRDYAELWRPWQKYLDNPHRYEFNGEPGPVAPSPEDRPPSLPTYLLERTVNPVFANYMLSSRANVAAIILRTYSAVTDRPWPGATGEVGDLIVPLPPTGPDREAMERLYVLPADQETGTLQTLFGVPRGLDADCWMPMRNQQPTHEHRALAGRANIDSAAPALDEETLTAAEVPEPGPEATAWLHKQQAAVEDATVTEDDDALLPEWEADDDTNPGVTYADAVEQ